MKRSIKDMPVLETTASGNIIAVEFRSGAGSVVIVALVSGGYWTARIAPAEDYGFENFSEADAAIYAATGGAKLRPEEGAAFFPFLDIAEYKPN